MLRGEEGNIRGPPGIRPSGPGRGLEPGMRGTDSGMQMHGRGRGGRGRGGDFGPGGRGGRGGRGGEFVEGGRGMAPSGDGYDYRMHGPPGPMDRLVGCVRFDVGWLWRTHGCGGGLAGRCWLVLYKDYLPVRSIRPSFIVLVRRGSRHATWTHGASSFSHGPRYEP